MKTLAAASGDYDEELRKFLSGMLRLGAAFLE